MDKSNAIRLFKHKQIRTHWNEDNEKRYFSVVDVISVLADQSTHQGARNYWKVLKNRLLKEGNQTVTNCNRLKMQAPDGRLRFTDVADTEQLLRLIQSVPSKKAEPFKQWLAKVGRERIDEIEDPELGFDRLLETYFKKGGNVAKAARLKLEETTKKKWCPNKMQKASNQKTTKI